MGQFRDQLIEVIRYYHLDRFAEAQPILARVNHGPLSEFQAKVLLFQLSPLIKRQIDSPNFLHAPPDEEQLYAGGRPEIELGTTENGLRFGLRISDRPRHVLSVGSTRSGKTTGVRKLILGIDQWSRERGRPVSLFVMDPKGGDYADLTGLGNHWRHFSVHDGLHLSLGVPGVPVRTSTFVVSTQFRSRMGLVAAQTTMAGLMQWLVPLLNPNPTHLPVLYPDFQLLLDVIRAGPLTLWASKSQYEDSLIQALV
jgi:hypothetical protein